MFKISDSEREGFRYLDVVTDNSTYYTVNGLNLDTEYVFTIMAFNDRGNSNYMQDVVKTKTSSKATFSDNSFFFNKMTYSLNCFT